MIAPTSLYAFISLCHSQKMNQVLGMALRDKSNLWFNDIELMADLDNCLCLSVMKGFNFYYA